VADARQIEQELSEYLEKEPNLRRSDRLQYLMAIMNKHFELDKIDHLVNHYDLSQLISAAKTSFATKAMPIYISRKEVHGSEIPHVLIIEAFVGYLNRNKLLKRLVKFDYGR
jgi:hypothetical protein